MGGHRTHFTLSNPHLKSRLRHNKLTGKPPMKSEQDSPEYRRDLEKANDLFLNALGRQQHLAKHERHSSPPAEPGRSPTKND
jgi:hypothetical protein